ncbi:MAG: hypothetical protein AMJ69_06840 [Gammaproteobacteria bacterium SG8_47]|nr:MAG: hypothetical protein AMJ69_06840 [Gammaproteobacteria bacterium SG8_47]
MQHAYSIPHDSDDVRVERVVEALCATGCNAVRASIAALEAGLPVPGTEQLDPMERRQVLNDLRAIMAVYDR